MQNSYNSGDRIPREKKFEVNEQLASKHIQTLQFVQEVVNENKVLKKKVIELEQSQSNCDELHNLAEESKEKIKTIQELHLKRADEINATMAEKHRGEIMTVVQEKLEQEQQLSENMVQLKQEIGHLENTNRELLERIHELLHSHTQIEVLNAQIEDQKRIIVDLRFEVEVLQTENQDLSGEKMFQFSQMQGLQSLKSANESLTHDLKSMSHKNTEFTHKISQLEAQLKETSNTKEQMALIDSLKNKLGKLHKERSVAVEKDEFYQKEVGDLRYEIEALKEKLKNTEVTKDRVLEEYYNVHAELQYLKKNYMMDHNNKNFKEFVKLKREVGLLHEENSELKRANKLAMPVGSVTSLPMLRFEVDQPAVKARGSKKGHKSKNPHCITSS